MRASGSEIRFAQAGEWALFKIRLGAGAYGVRAEGSVAGKIEIRIREDESATVTPFENGAARFAIDQPRKVFLYLELEPGSRLAGLTIEPNLGP